MTSHFERLAKRLSDCYRLHSTLGSGANAHVYVADELKTGRRVAIKVLREEQAAGLAQLHGEGEHQPVGAEVGQMRRGRAGRPPVPAARFIAAHRPAEQERPAAVIVAVEDGSAPALVGVEVGPGPAVVVGASAGGQKVPG